MDDWTRVKISCTPEQVEQVSAIAMMVDSHIMVEDNSDIEQYNSMYGELIDESLKSCEDTSVSVFVPKERDLAQAMAFLRERLAASGLDVTVSAEGLHEEDWADNWKQYYHPVRVGEHIVIVPEWEMETFEPREGDVVVMMDPGMAFGTGTHETTRLCAALMEDTVERGSRITDVGTGSGILAIIAAKLGAGHIDAYDIDPMSVRVARENIEKNGCVDRISCSESDLLASAPDEADMITANITADIILRMAPSVPRCVRRGGLVVLSGIIDPQCNAVIEAMESQGFEKLRELHENDWAGLLMRREG